MRISIIQRILGMLLVIYSVSLLPPLAISWFYQDDVLLAFLMPFFIMLLLGLTLWLSAPKAEQDLSLHDGFLIMVIFWVVLSLVSALPFLFADNFNGAAAKLSIAQAVFEAVSGFTTTGATVLSEIETLPKSLLYYRQQLQFLGGLGVIIVAIAVLPMLGIGGMQLYRAEAPGPMNDDKLTPRLEHTAKALLLVYVLLTVACTLAFWAAGMTFFDALTHSYTTVSTSGFSTHDDSLGYFDSWEIEAIAILFMLLGSLNFTLHYLALHRPHWKYYREDIQTRVFFRIVAILILVSTAMLYGTGFYPDFLEALRQASFHVVSIITTTGFTINGVNGAGESVSGFAEWPSFLPVLIFASGFIGGCVGSTAGGFRVMRVILLFKQGVREIMRLIHPNAVLTLRIDRKRVSDRVAEAVWGFAFLYMASYIVLSVLILAVDPEQGAFTAFAAAAACLNMIGPGLEKVAGNFAGFNDGALIISTFAMLLGRLEIFTFLVLLMPAFWRR